MRCRITTRSTAITEHSTSIMNLLGNLVLGGAFVYVGLFLTGWLDKIKEFRKSLRKYPESKLL